MEGQVVVITGASRGIGAAAAQAFSAAGARTALLARSTAEIRDLADRIGEGAMALPCDVANWASVQAAMDAVLARFGRIDVLVNNAGVIEPIARLADADPVVWAKAQDINLKGVFHGMKAALPAMRAQGGGTIVTVSSGAALRPLEGWSAYCASKAGALMLTQALHLEESANGIRALGLSPGTVATEMQMKIRDSSLNPVSQIAWEDHIPPEWPARALVWMCGAAADPWLGRDISLRDEDIRRAVGLLS